MIVDQNTKRKRKNQHDYGENQQISASAENAQTKRNEIAFVRDMVANENAVQGSSPKEHTSRLLHSVWPYLQV